MKPFVKVMSFAALSVTTAMVPNAAAQAPPAADAATPATKADPETTEHPRYG